jgi:hypothetical protein
MNKTMPREGQAATPSHAPLHSEQTGDLRYELENGYLHAWLVAGPVRTPVLDLDQYRGEDFKAQIARAYYRQPDIAQLKAAEGRRVNQQDPNGEQHALLWQVVRCGDDHYVNLSAFYHTCHYVTAWAYAKVAAPAAQEVTLTLTTNGPADVWVNGEHAHRQVHHALQRPQSERFTASLQAGENEILVRFEVVGARACPFLMALHLDAENVGALHIRLPTTRLPVARRSKLEQIFDQAYVKQSVYHRQEELSVHWPDTMQLSDRITVRLQSREGRIYGEGRHDVKKGTIVNLGAVYQVPDGDYDVVIMPDIEEYYLHHMQIERRIPIRIINQKHNETPAGTFAERRREALSHAAASNLNLYSEIARMALGDWQRVRQDAVRHAIERINQRVDCADFDMVGLLGAMIRHGDDPNFPEALRQPIMDCAVNFKYWMDEPGDDAMCYWTENHQILFHTCQVLAGQLFPEARFSNTGQSGTWHRMMGEQRALSWLRKRAAGGFQEWDSNCYFTEDVLALAHLADLAVDETVAEMAAVVLDKLAFTMALNSFKGVFGSTHGRSYTSLILGGRAESTSGISRLLWGQGTFNSSIRGTVALACAQTYELPPIIQAIATDRDQALWNRERHAGRREAWCDLDNNAWEINKVTYKTPDYMLASAQDYRPGTQGFQQHVWQATLHPDAVVFANHPVCVSTQNDLRPSYWSGNGVLPRVAQWKDTLIGIYHLPPDDWMGWTHAYFPVASFDEFTLQDGWIFGRKGDGYVAITAANGLRLVEQGEWAFREIRSPGLHNVWICQMGRRGEDGDFAEFAQKVTAHPPRFADLSVELQTLRGDRLSFGWEESLQLNGNEQPITGFRHYDNDYCQAELPCEEMFIQYQDQLMRLDFALDADDS